MLVYQNNDYFDCVKLATSLSMDHGMQTSFFLSLSQKVGGSWCCMYPDIPSQSLDSTLLKISFCCFIILACFSYSWIYVVD